MTSRPSRFVSSGSITQSPRVLHLPEGPILRFEAENLFFFFRQWSNQSWAVQISAEPEPDFFSIALQPGVEPAEVAWEEDEEGFHLSGPGEIFLDSETGFLSWYYQGEKVLETENGLGFGTLGAEFLACFHLEPHAGFFGLGEKTGELNKRGAGFTNWNTDAFGYGNGRDPLYVSIPFFLGVNQGRSFGLLLDNTAKSRFNFGASNKRMVQISVDSGPMNLVFIPGPRPEEVLKRYHQLTGFMPLPPLWALGLQQCRYSYYPESELRSVARNYRDRDIPCDVLYLDIHYMDAYKVFTEDKKRFPDLKKLCRELGMEHFRVVPIQDPGIKVQPGYPPYDSGKKAGLFVRYPDGADWVAGVWPGDCVFPDFTNPEARQWWATLTADWVNNTGVSGLWNDMNEPATWGQDIPDMIEFDWEGRTTTHREAHNAYGQKMAESSSMGLELAYPGKRTFLLTRAGFAGIHRSAAVWTGDNVANEEHLFLSIRMVLGLGMSGVSFAGPDIGGFVGDAGKLLFVRWISIGAFFPFFRLHSMIDSRDNEPWSYGEWCEAVARNYIRLRYRLLPYLYTRVEESNRQGLPVLRPYFWGKPALEYEPAFQHQFFFGPDLLVIPAASEQAAVWADLPEGNWFHLFSGKKFTGNQALWLPAPPDSLPVLVREGAILVTGTVGTSTQEVFSEGLDIHLFYSNKAGQGSLYIDDGESRKTRAEDGRRLLFRFEPDTRQVTIESEFGSKPVFIRKIYTWHFPEIATLRINEASFTVTPDEFHWLDSLPNFDPFEDKSVHYFSSCQSVDFHQVV